MPNLGILKTLSICYYRIATEQEKDRKEEKRNALYQRYRHSAHLFIFSRLSGLLYFMFCGVLTEVRRGKFEVSVTIAYLWVDVGWLQGSVWKYRDSYCWGFTDKNLTLVNCFIHFLNFVLFALMVNWLGLLFSVAYLVHETFFLHYPPEINGINASFWMYWFHNSAEHWWRFASDFTFWSFLRVVILFWSKHSWGILKIFAFHWLLATSRCAVFFPCAFVCACVWWTKVGQ